MSDEQFGSNPFVSLEQLKNYLSISSTTYDTRLTTLLNYATGVVENYIGQEILAKDYTEVFDGGKSSLFVSRLPLSNVYSVSEFTGSDFTVLNDPTTTGVPVVNNYEPVSFNSVNEVYADSKSKRFGNKSIYFNGNSYLYANTTNDYLGDDSFTIELFTKIPTNTMPNTELLNLSSDVDNYFSIGLMNSYGMYSNATIDSTSTAVLGANTFIEMRQFYRKKWAHIAVTRDADNDRLYMFYNGNTVANASFSVDSMNFSNITVGAGFTGHIDELRISSIARYTNNFVPSANRFRPDNDTSLLLHFDTNNIQDASSLAAEYTYSKDTGEITKLSVQGSGGSPDLSLRRLTTFTSQPNGVIISYRAGYEIGKVPYDLMVATMDYAKMLYKQDQEKQGFSLEGEKGTSYNLSANFPPHIKRVLDLYRIIQ